MGHPDISRQTTDTEPVNLESIDLSRVSIHRESSSEFVESHQRALLGATAFLCLSAMSAAWYYNFLTLGYQSASALNTLQIHANSKLLVSQATHQYGYLLSPACHPIIESWINKLSLASKLFVVCEGANHYVRNTNDRNLGWKDSAKRFLLIYYLSSLQISTLASDFARIATGAFTPNLTRAAIEIWFTSTLALYGLYFYGSQLASTMSQNNFKAWQAKTAQNQQEWNNNLYKRVDFLKAWDIYPEDSSMTGVPYVLFGGLWKDWIFNPIVRTILELPTPRKQSNSKIGLSVLSNEHETLTTNTRS